MTTGFRTAAPSLAVALILAAFGNGCQSVQTVNLHGAANPPADQVVTLVAPWCIGLSSVDGQALTPTARDEMRVLLKPGPHALVARYNVFYPLRDGDVEKITSRHISLAFTGRGGRTYTICSKQPRSLEETQDYANNVSLWIEESTPDTARVATTPLAAAPPPAPQAPSEPPVVAAPPAEPPATSPPAADATVSDELQRIWSSASEAERKAFLESVQPPAP